MSLDPNMMHAQMVVKRTRGGSIISSEAILRPQRSYGALPSSPASPTSSVKFANPAASMGLPSSAPDLASSMGSADFSNDALLRKRMMRMNSARALSACAALDGMSKTSTRKRIGFDVDAGSDLEK